MSYVAFGCRALLGVVFLAAVAGKLFSRREFIESWGTTAAVLTVTGEACIVVLLAIPTRAAGLAGFSLAVTLLAIFAVAITHSVRLGNTQPCLCFGRSSTPLGRLHLWRNIFLACTALLGSIVTTLPAGPSALAPALAAAVAGLIAGVIVISL